MNLPRIARFAITIFIVTLVAALGAIVPAQAQSGLSVVEDTMTSITIAWTPAEYPTEYDIMVWQPGGGFDLVGRTSESEFTLYRLRPGKTYIIEVVGIGQIIARTDSRKSKPADTQPPMMTCSRLPAGIVVKGYAFYTGCQVVDAVGVGLPSVIARGVVSAVDIWQVVPSGLEVCFKGDGWLVFLDADYSPRMAMDLAHDHHDDMTCGTIDHAGTVVLVATPAPAATPAPPANTLPVFDAIPLDDCLIKLVDTLFLRAQPGGEVIGLVWLNSEVPVFEIKGYWYKVEFEGQVGYISRYYRTVVRGGCG